MKVNYQITYPNAKIYCGKNLTDLHIFVWDASSTLIQQDFTKEQTRDFSIKKRITWESEMASVAIGNFEEVRLINQYKFNNAEIGYNRWPKFKGGF